jgi:uncharacterized protein (TIGR03118 family)
MNTNCRKALDPVLDGYQKVTTVADNPFYEATNVDADLVNPWGISYSPTSPVWVSDEGAGVSTLYQANGTKVPLTVFIPGRNSTSAPGSGTPTGTVFNNTTDFWYHSGDTMAQAKFLFSTLWGQIVAWSGGDSGVVVANMDSDFAVYTGLALAQSGGNNYLYAPDFRDGRIDVYDKDFNRVPGIKFVDSQLPPGYAPFNVKVIAGELYVTYALQYSPRLFQAEAGAGNGIVDLFAPDGTFIIRFATNGALNAPWGIAASKVEFAAFGDSIKVGVILVGNHGDGHINMYTTFGLWLGALMSTPGQPVVIDSLWDIDNNVPGGTPLQLFYTAGRHDGHDGNFGFITKMP